MILPLLNNRRRKPLKMNPGRLFCYSLAVKGILAISGANHALLVPREARDDGTGREH
jgi:hypothetical protein